VTVRIVDSIDVVPPVAWAALARGRSLYLSQPWLRSCERGPGMAARYLLAEDAGLRLVGALPAYLTGARGTPHHYDPFAVLGRPLLGGAARREDWLPTLLGGSRAGAANGLLLHPDLDPAARRAVLCDLLAAFDRLAQHLGARSWRRPSARCRC
jgi:hypothetical protein